jgi:hypothetical protein
MVLISFLISLILLWFSTICSFLNNVVLYVHSGFETNLISISQIINIKKTILEMNLCFINSYIIYLYLIGTNNKYFLLNIGSGIWFGDRVT